MNRPLLLAFALLGLATPLTAEMTPEELGRKLDAKLQSGFPAVYRIEMTGITTYNPADRQTELDALNQKLQAEQKKPEASRNAAMISTIEKNIEGIKGAPTEQSLSHSVILKFISLDKWIFTDIAKTDVSSGTRTFYSSGNGVVFQVNNRDKSIFTILDVRDCLAKNLTCLPQFTVPQITAKDAAEFSLATKDGRLVLTRNPRPGKPGGLEIWTIDPETLTVLSYTRSFSDRIREESTFRNGAYHLDTLWTTYSKKQDVTELKIEKPEEPIDPDFTIPAGYTVQINNKHDSFQIPSDRLGGMKASAVTPEILDSLIKPELAPVIYEPK